MQPNEYFATLSASILSRLSVPRRQSRGDRLSASATKTSVMPVYPVRRRPRECKTCLPCRASKVRCDRNVPCSNCVKRNFSCTYGRPPPSNASKPPLLSDPFATATATTTTSAVPSPQFPPPSSFPPAGGDGNRYSFTSTSVGDYGGPDPDPHASLDTVSLSQMEWDEVNSKMRAMEQIVTSLHSLFQNHSERRPTDPRSEMYTSDDGMSFSGAYDSSRLETGEVHIGARSALLDILGKTQGAREAAQGLPTGELLAELAMGNESAAYPFVDLWSSDPFTFNIAGVCGVLPDDEQCRRSVPPPPAKKKKKKTTPPPHNFFGLLTGVPVADFSTSIEILGRCYTLFSRMCGNWKMT